MANITNFCCLLERAPACCIGQPPETPAQSGGDSEVFASLPGLALVSAAQYRNRDERRRCYQVLTHQLPGRLAVACWPLLVGRLFAVPSMPASSPCYRPVTQVLNWASAGATKAANMLLPPRDTDDDGGLALHSRQWSCRDM